VLEERETGRSAQMGRASLQNDETILEINSSDGDAAL
jgi:hypothetical protein